jgi:putative ABC transport system permease protein
MGPSKITQLVSMVLRCPDAHGCSGIEASVAQSVERAGGRLLWADTMEHVLGSKLAGAELRTLVSGTYGLLGLILAVAAIYGTVRYTAMTRIRELTIRMALGASRTSVQRLLVRHGLIVAGVGVVIGAGIALPLLSVVRSLVYGLAFVDPLAYAAAGAALLVGALAASIGPARRLSNTSLRRVLND